MSLIPQASKQLVNSVTIKPGEQFTLPPGAVMLGVSNPAALLSTCDLPPSLEALDCYVIQVITNDSNTGGPTHSWDADEIEAVGIRVGGKNYLFPAIIDNFLKNIAGFTTALKALHPVFLSGIQHSSCEQHDDRSKISNFCFKSIPSLADDLYLIIRPQWGGGWSYFKAIPISENQSVCSTCTC